MKRWRMTVVAAVVALGSVLVAVPAGADVPGLGYTDTRCEGDTDSVARLYRAALGRLPDRGGFEFWVGAYHSGGWSLPEMAEFFVGSAEFQRNHGDLDDDAFVRQMYQNVLRRQGDRGGIEFWTGRLHAGLSRSDLLLRFSESPENVELTGTTASPLGPYNGGRDDGWSCGASLGGALLALQDMPTGWSPDGPPSGSGSSHDCFEVFRSNVSAPTSRFDYDEFSFVFNRIETFPTAALAAEPLARKRELLASCSAPFVVDGWTYVMEPVRVEVEGADDWFAMHTVGTHPDSWSGYENVYVVARVGSVTVAVAEYGGWADSWTVERYAELVVSRVLGDPDGTSR